MRYLNGLILCLTGWMKLTVFKSRRGRPSQYLQQALQLNNLRQPLVNMVQNHLDSQEGKSKGGRAEFHFKPFFCTYDGIKLPRNA